MGDDAGRPDERPAHRVTVREFRIAIEPVTNEEYAHFLAATSHPAPKFWNDPAFSKPRQPVVGVSWFDTVAYCEWLSAVTARQFRLPTEAEWERAARGGVDSRFPWGDEPFDGNGGRFAQESTWDVGTAPPNPYGLVDIGFNVHEWCLDWYYAEYYASSPADNPAGPATGERRASRGGAWRHLVKVSKCSARSSLPPAYQYNDYGFRVVEST